MARHEVRKISRTLRRHDTAAAAGAVSATEVVSELDAIPA